MRKRRARPTNKGEGDCFPRKRYQAKRIPGVPACDPAIWLASARLHGNSPEIGAQSQSSPRNSPGGDGDGGGGRVEIEMVVEVVLVVIVVVMLVSVVATASSSEHTGKWSTTSLG
ncbi:hypothetical protein V1478_006533, partial [Vespula squamosa]